MREKDLHLLKLEMEKLLNIVGGDQPNEHGKNVFRWRDLVTQPGRQAVIITFVLMALSQCCGSSAMLTYTANIFKEAGSTLTPNMSAVVVGAIQFIGAFIASNLIDRTGRKVKQTKSLEKT